MKKNLFCLSLLLGAFMYGYSQAATDQNGLGTFVTNALSASSSVAKRFEVATVSYNSYHWQYSGSVIVEVFHNYWKNGYQKYIIDGYGAGNGSPSIALVEFKDNEAVSRISLGTPYDLGSSHSGYVNKAVPIYLDVLQYSSSVVRISYLQEPVSTFTGMNQIILNQSPSGSDISAFSIPVPDQQLSTSGDMVVGGKLGIGKSNPSVSLDIEGYARAKSVRSSGAMFSTGDADDDDLSTTDGAIVMRYDHSNHKGYIISKDYANASPKPMELIGSTVRLNATGGMDFYTNNIPGLLINSSQVVLIPNYLNIGSGRGFVTWDNGIFRLLGTAGNAMSFGANGSADQLYLATSGNVGIGTTNPSDAKLAVNGIVKAKKLKVTQSTWADMVFEDKYNLKPLTEVEIYIQKFKRLPDIPSAMDVQQADLDIGEMNRLLLLKVEELTLYLIEQNKRIAALETRLQGMGR